MKTDKNHRWIYTYDYAPDSVWEPWREDVYRKPSWIAEEADRVAARIDPSLPSYLLLTDSHFTYNGTWDDTVSSMLEVADRVKLTGVIHLGDLSDGLLPLVQTREIEQRVIGDMERLGVPVYLVPGNHDYNYFKNNPDIRYPDTPQYYVDIAEQKLRMIFIDSYDPKEAVRYGFSEYCIHWLEAALRLMPEDFMAIVFSHVTPLVRLQAWTDNIRNREKLMAVLDRHAARILAMINGHSHCDHLFNDLHNGRFPLITINCAKCEYFTDHKPEGAFVPERRLGDRTQESFDVMQIDTGKREMRFVRFGAGKDRFVKNHRASYADTEENACSVCMIVRNEAANLSRCLSALAPLRAEIIVVDTGSTDNTADIAREHGAIVCPFEWVNDFSAARNFAASKASCDMILAVDADEYLTEADIPLLTKQVKEYKGSVGMITRISPTVRDGAEQTMKERVARLYDRTRFRYTGSIHENIAPVDPGTELSFYELPLTFLHGGYETAELVGQKANRDLSMLLSALETEEDKPYLHYQTGKCHVALKNKEKAIAHYEKALSFKPDDRLFYVQDLVESYGYCLLETGQVQQALSFLTSLPEHFTKQADFCFLLGLVYMNNAKFPEAVAAFEQATACKACAVEGCNSYRAYYNIGVIWEVTGNTDEARRWYQKCGAFEPARNRLAGM